MNRKSNQIMFEDRTVAELVTEDFRRAEVFKKFSIDFCCGGKKKLADVCRQKGVDIEEIGEALRDAASGRDAARHNFSQWNPAFLADYIVNVHHSYVRESIPLLREFTMKVARVHGEAHPEVVEIARLFSEVAAELEQHMFKEEHILFPYIKRLENAAGEGAPLAAPPFGTVQNPIQMMEHEHDHAGNLMKEIRARSDDFTPPAEACNTYRASFFKLNEFEEDLHQHIHLENNILFPRAIQLEQQLLQK